MDNREETSVMGKVLNFKDLVEILPFGRNKTLELCQRQVLPVIKIGKDYVTTDKQLQKWFEENVGKTFS